MATHALRKKVLASKHKLAQSILPINTPDGQEVKGKEGSNLDLHKVWIGDQ